MKEWAYHWLYLDFYVPVWPNIAAGVISGLFVALWHDMRHHGH